MNPDQVTRALALTRIGLGLATITYAMESHSQLRRVVDGGLLIPVTDAMPSPTEGALQVYFAIAAISGLAIVLGSFTIQAAVVATGANVWLLLADQQTYTNHGWLLTVLVFLLAFTQSDRIWAVGASRRGPRTAAPWPNLLMMAQLSVCYFFAGISKVNPGFLSGDPFDAWLRWDLPAAIDTLMAVSTVLTEVCVAVGLWFWRTRLLAAALGIALHVSIVVLLAPLAIPLITFALICLAVYPLFFALEPRTASAGRRVVIWDSHCSFCRRWVQTFRLLDWLRLHRFVGSAEPDAFDDPRVTPEMADRAVQLLTPTRRAEGFDAVRRIFAVSPVTFWLAPLLWIPPVYRLGDRAYQRVAARRTCKI